MLIEFYNSGSRNQHAMPSYDSIRFEGKTPAHLLLIRNATSKVGSTGSNRAVPHPEVFSGTKAAFARVLDIWNGRLAPANAHFKIEA